ncbi:MAG: family N-acetyltransferase [Ilumatobacteraceae bacterium]|nr:family N-acetyltransferase [Ilumatobacteraceae bacterium]
MRVGCRAAGRVLTPVDHLEPAPYHRTVPTVEYPDPVLGDGSMGLRPWTLSDLPCVEEASTDTRIPEGTTVPRQYSDDEGRAFIERQWARLTSGDGLSMAVRSSDDVAVGLIVLMRRPQAAVWGIGYWVVPVPGANSWPDGPCA